MKTTSFRGGTSQLKQISAEKKLSKIHYNQSLRTRISLLNLKDNVYHPFQELADTLTVKEKFGGVKNIRNTKDWAYFPSVHKHLAETHSALLYATMMRMKVTLASPEGRELDPKTLKQCKQYSKASGRSFRETNDLKVG